MCFTHDDPAADANAKLDKIAVEIDAIGKKLGRLDIWDFLGCCVFQPANGCFECRLLVRIICFCVKTDFFVFFRH